MPDPADPLPADVLAALQRGDAVTAIKLLRASTGLGLKEAKDAIDAHLSGRPVAQAPAPAAAEIRAAVADALRRGNKIEAIKLLREETGLGLMEAKEAIDAYEQEIAKTGGATRAAGIDGLSPGEVPKSGNGALMAIAVAIAAAAAWYFLRTPG